MVLTCFPLTGGKYTAEPIQRYLGTRSAGVFTDNCFTLTAGEKTGARSIKVTISPGLAFLKKGDDLTVACLTDETELEIYDTFGDPVSIAISYRQGIVFFDKTVSGEEVNRSLLLWTAQLDDDGDWHFYDRRELMQESVRQFEDDQLLDDFGMWFHNFQFFTAIQDIKNMMSEFGEDAGVERWVDETDQDLDEFSGTPGGDNLGMVKDGGQAYIFQRQTAWNSPGVVYVPTAGEGLGVVKNGGNVSINPNGTMNKPLEFPIMPVVRDDGNYIELSDDHVGKLLYCTNNYGTTKIILTGEEFMFPVGAKIQICCAGTAAIHFESEFSTLVSEKGARYMTEQYSTAILKKLDNDKWLLSGDIANSLN